MGPEVTEVSCQGWVALVPAITHVLVAVAALVGAYAGVLRGHGDARRDSRSRTPAGTRRRRARSNGDDVT